MSGEEKNKDKVYGLGDPNHLGQFYPLFLHSNDNNGIPLISFKLEGPENYKLWSTAITIAIHTKNKLDFISGKTKRPVEASILQEQ